MRKQRVSVWLAVVCLFGAVSLPAQSGSESDPNSGPSANGVPRLIKFSGAINPQITQIAQSKENESGKNPLPTMVEVTFSLYELQEGGSPLWSEGQKVQVGEQGHYTVLLGATETEGLPLDLFVSGKALWLGVQPQLPGATEQARVLLVAVPYALKAADADTLGGLPASAFLSATASQRGGASSQSSSARSANGRPSTDKQLSAAAPQAGAACSGITSDGAATGSTLAKFTSACNLESSLIRDNGIGVAVGGAATPGALLDVQFTSTATSGPLLGQRVLTTLNPGATSSTLTFGLFSNAQTASGNAQNLTSNLYAMEFETDHFGTGTLAGAYGAFGSVINRAAGTITNAYGIYTTLTNASTGNINTGYGVYVSSPANSGGGTFSNYYGLYVANPTTAVPAAFGDYSGGGTNYFNGNVGIGTNSPSAKLEVNGTTRFDMPVTFCPGRRFREPGR